MIDDDVKIVALVLIGLTMMATIYPVFTASFTPEAFSEIAVLGPSRLLKDYPKTIAVDESIDLFLFVKNLEGKVEYYRVYVKLDQTGDTSAKMPLDVTPLAKYDFVLKNVENATLPINISVNHEGDKQRLVFELYVYDRDNLEFDYKGVWAHIWLNVTKTS